MLNIQSISYSWNEQLAINFTDILVKNKPVHLLFFFFFTKMKLYNWIKLLLWQPKTDSIDNNTVSLHFP